MLLVYALYFGAAVVAMWFVWRRTAGMSDLRRLILRSTAVAILFGPATAGMRPAPFLLALLALITFDLIFVRPLSTTWALQALTIFARDMLLPLMASWSVLLVVGAVVQYVNKNKQQ